jgi:predicted lipid-binding transport protein (Tim44 family)
MQFRVLQLILLLTLASVGDAGFAAPSAEKPPAQPAAKPAETPVAAAPPAKPSSEKASADKTAREREALSALLMWCCILVVGLGLIAAAMVWARRLRRASRRQPAASTQLDPFWYLKKKPARTTAAGPQPDVPGPESSGTAGPGDPGTS